MSTTRWSPNSSHTPSHANIINWGGGGGGGGNIIINDNVIYICLCYVVFTSSSGVISVVLKYGSYSDDEKQY